MPAFRLAPLAWTASAPQNFDALLLTSGNAVRLAGPKLAEYAALPVYAVGEATAQAARKAGLDVQHIGNMSVAALLPVAERAGHTRLLWLAGRDRIALDPGADMAIEIATVYESDALPAPTDFARRVAEADAVLLHSPRAAAHFGWLCDIAGIARHKVTLAALSLAIAEAAGEGWRDLLVAETPSDASLLYSLESGPKHQP